MVSEHPGEPRHFWRTSRRTLNLSGRPLIMGILNVTPDSFFDGGLRMEIGQAVDHAVAMVEAGADIIDIGGESTRPGSSGVSEDEELRRVMPLIEHLVPLLNIPLSLDTTKSGVASRALAAGVEIINDISGLTFDPRMSGVVADVHAGLVIMHTRGLPVSMQLDTSYVSLVSEVCSGLAASLQLALSAGITAEQIVLDPGLGFAKDRAGNLELLRSLREFLFLERPLLVGSSNKGFTATAAGRSVQNRLFTTAATVALAVANGATLLRVHDVAAMRDVADMAWEIAG
jgi:dihydropteroate synthase